MRLLPVAALSIVACQERKAASAEVSLWTVDSYSRIEINDDDLAGSVLLGNAVHASRRPEGGLVVVDQGLNSLRFFSSDGQLERAVGREGSGPGEFEFIRLALRCGDSLFVEDIVTRRVSVYSLDGKLARALSTREFGGGAEAYRSACNAWGDFVHHAWNSFDPSVRGRSHNQLPLWISSAKGDERVALEDVSGPEYIGFGSGAAPALLGRTPQLGMSSQHVYVGTADSGVVQVYTLDGSRAGIRRIPEGNTAVRELDLELAKRIDFLGQNPATQEETRRIWELDSPPASLPAYDAIVVDSDSYLWVRRYPVAGRDSTRWFVFDPSGPLVATLLLPSDLTVTEIDTRHIVGIVRSAETGRHSVLQVSLNRSAKP